LLLIKINRIYFNREKLCKKIQNTSDNFEKFHIFCIFSNYLNFFFQKSAKMAKTLQIQSKTTIKSIFEEKNFNQKFDFLTHSEIFKLP
jgi:hypothetical protein